MNRCHVRDSFSITDTDKSAYFALALAKRDTEVNIPLLKTPQMLLTEENDHCLKIVFGCKKCTLDVDMYVSV